MNRDEYVKKLKTQLEKIAAKRTGGAKTDAILDRESGPEGLPHSIIVTAEGTEGEAPVLPGAEPSAAAPPEEPKPVRRKTKGKTKARPKKTAKRKAKAPKHKKGKKR